MIALEPVIGIEIHVELNTKSKVFSKALASYGSKPNTNINVIDLGYPGTLPTLNKEVVRQAIKVAIILNCNLNKVMHFDRKNYFYPDVPKNYQITQSRTPIGYDGYLDIEVDGETKRIGISRVHIEEDTAKSNHINNKTLLDFNRAGIPLLEIVTQPDISNAREAMIYVETLRQMLLYSEVSDVKIEEGSMRCDVNISMKPKSSNELGNKIEIKNIGSIFGVGESIKYEIDRQTELINNNVLIEEETRRYDDKTNTTILMRVKETGNDYRYFPEPDIPYVELTDEWIEEMRRGIPRMPNERYRDYLEVGINDIVANKLIGNKSLSDFFEIVLKNNVNLINAANILTSDVAGYLNKNNVSLKDTKLEVDNFIKLLTLLDKGDISSKIVKELLPDMLANGTDVEKLIAAKGTKIISDETQLTTIISDIISNNSSAVIDYQNGKDKAIKYLMGEIMKTTKGQANPVLARDILINILKKQ